MSVMVIDKEYFERIGKFFTLTMSEDRAKELCHSLSELNVRNYCERYNEPFTEGLEFQANELNFSEVAIPSAVQVMSDLKAIHYNCIDYGEKINKNVLNDLKDRISRLERSPEYQLTKQYAESVKY
ncbi:hypothetical protein ABES80_12255 [Bacillus gobiensis]|uniref:hypothetical protein n=1 Tax=Bacillus gobiensis TaxID=1441095 RepID=UPI003D1968BC